MKTENTPEAKARFFALYWGQNIRFWTLNGSEILHKVTHTYMTKAILESCSLLLTPLSQISDEDAIEVSKIFNKDMGLNEDTHRYYGRNFWSTYTTYVPVYKYLISKGYYVGDGTEIEYGWAVLKGGDTCKP